MLSQIFSNYYLEILKKTPIEKVTEIRLRTNKKIVICIANKSYYLGVNGLTGKNDEALICTKEMIDEIVKRACENSVYAFGDQIKNGFITIKNGIRLGLGGEGVIENGEVKTLKNISSLSIRFAHEVKGCSLKLFPFLMGKGFLNTLIVSPPGAGKTTLIRDIVLQLSRQSYCYNVLICDERGEIANCIDGLATLDTGNFCDILSNIPKKYAFEQGIRTLRPDIIVTDELFGRKDFLSIVDAKNCGVTVLASIHAKNIEELKSKTDFDVVTQNKVFDRIVLLSSKDGPGTIEGIFDSDLRLLDL